MPIMIFESYLDDEWGHGIITFISKNPNQDQSELLIMFALNMLFYILNAPKSRM